ncbi:MAG TPA: hypothetical protein VFQ25_02560 [Ktedonobacterales bacterium]|nr:hypothetical protein [Ktedonobacterales bacterium]
MSKWLKYEANVGSHVCQYMHSNATVGGLSVGPAAKLGDWQTNASLEYQNSIWGGKVADQNCGSQGQGLSCQDFTHNYIETDTDYYVHCPTQYTPQITATSTITAWAGIGGTASYYELQQAGTSVEYIAIESACLARYTTHRHGSTCCALRDAREGW